MVPVADGWAGTSINAVIFRRNSVVTHENAQYVAFYDPEGNVVLGKRRLGSAQWELKTTPYSGNVRDAHNSISIMVDGKGYLHMAWDHHVKPLHYCRTTAPGSLKMGPMQPMTGRNEDRVTYPEFYRLPNGNLLFFYRSGSSGNGDLMINHYDVATEQWTQRQAGFISGERERNAYWQVCVDDQGVIHLSWVWRETGDVATNHDLGYARSRDGGKTWERSTGEPYVLPITEDTAEYALRIPQNSELINQTSMCADARGRPYIATYWREPDSEVPQYHLVFHDGVEWHVMPITRRTTPFSLRGGGTKRIPISRPKLIAIGGDSPTLIMVFRDSERGEKVSAALCHDLERGEWDIQDLNDFSVAAWEPTYDTELWRARKKLHLFVQKVGQGDGETVEATAPQPISILEWRP